MLVIIERIEEISQSTRSIEGIERKRGYLNSLNVEVANKIIRTYIFILYLCVLDFELI